MADHIQQVIWTALPNGRGRRGAQVSLVVSPRLMVFGVPSTDLGNYEAWSHWPDVVRNATFGVRFGRSRVPARIVSEPNPDVWKMIFGPHTLVINHAFEDLSDKVPITYSVADMYSRLKDTYSAIAGAYVDEFPDVQTMHDVLDPFESAPSGPDLLKRLASDGGKGYLGEVGKVGLADLARFHGYHTPFDLPAGHLVPADAEAQLEGIDFHRIVAALGQYKRLLRETGLVVDLELEKELPMGTGLLSAEVQWNTGEGVQTEADVLPRTRVIHDRTRFEAVPKGTHITGRRLDLSDERYTPVQVDLDGGIIKLAGTGQSLRNRQVLAQQSGGKTEADVDPVGLPTLRTTGIMVAEEGRGESVMGRLTRATKFEDAVQAGKPVDLFAEDVVRGYHIDVREEKTWQSLCRVDVNYTFESGAELDEQDVEGIVQLSAGEAPPGSVPELANVLRFSEGLFQWDGWSLSAPRPGLAIDQEGNPKSGEEEAELPVAATEKVHPKSLPKLRFGATYQIRARLVDLAHNAEPWTAKDSKGSSSKIIFRRFEPVPPPVPALYRHFGQIDAPSHGGSLLRLVIRTGENGLEMPTGDVDSRLIYAPRTSVEMAERHGALDDANGRPRASLYALLAGRDEDLDQIDVGPASERKSYPVGDSSNATSPWLTDPMAMHTKVSMISDPPRFVSAGNSRFPNEAGKEVGPDADWPHQKPWTLRLREDPNRPERYILHQGVDFDLHTATTWDDQNRTLTVWLPKGEIVRAKLGHMFPGKPGDPSNIWGIAAWLKEALNFDVYQSMIHAINGGRHWAITPSLEIELVHAVQKPLTQFAPSISAPVRARGDSHAELTLSSPCHAESTADLSLEGAWVEAVDSQGSGPTAGWQSGRAFRETITDEHSPQGTVFLNGRHVFGDTKYRRVNYHLTGTSRFAEYFPPAIRNDAKRISRSSDDVVAHIPNAAPPPAPKPVRATPVFDWLRDADGNQKASWRRSGIRVYLDRPWFQTGFGEMLAAVLPRSNATNNAFNSIVEQVTHWGGDPIWKANGPTADIRTNAPTLDDFPARSLPGDGPDERWPSIFPEPERDLSGGNPSFHNLVLPDENGNEVARVDAAGHPVSWDADEGRYYADLMMTTGKAYQPFVSLSVARMHPVSAPSCHLSPAVRLETVQVLPERLGTCRRTNTGWIVQLYGHPHGFKTGVGQSGQDRPLDSVIRVEVQRAAGTAPDELDWETVDDANLAGEPDVRAIDPSVSFSLPSTFTPTRLFGSQAGKLRDGFAAFRNGGPKRLYSKRFKTPGAGGGSDGGDRWRIRVTEWERHKGDVGPGNATVTPAGTERLIFAETFDVTP